jgi:uncharacterized protein
MDLIPLFTGNLKIAVCETEGKRYGVFAMETIVRNELIEISPVLIIPTNLDHRISQFDIGNYVFEWKDGNSAIALGFGSFYNHSYLPNAVYNLNYGDSVIEFVALKKINEGSEITVNYNGSPDDHSSLWFEVLD